MTLPFQATECYLAHVQPVDGTWNWGMSAEDFFKSKCMNKVINATLIGRHSDDAVNMVELTFTEDEDGKVRSTYFVAETCQNCMSSVQPVPLKTSFIVPIRCGTHCQS